MTSWRTFRQMRDDDARDWYRLSDLIEAAATHGAALTEYKVRSAISHLPRPTIKRYGHWHYTEAHRQAVIEAAILAASANHSEIPTSSAPRGAMA